MQTVQLPSGASAVIRDATEVPERLRRAYLEAQAKMLKESGANVGANGEIDKESLDVVAMGQQIGPVRDALILAYTKSWSLMSDDGDTPLPLSIDAILDLPGSVYDALYKACNKAYQKDKGGVVDVSPEGVADPNSPTGPLDE